jgi:hypothetical protein
MKGLLQQKVHVPAVPGKGEKRDRSKAGPFFARFVESVLVLRDGADRADGDAGTALDAAVGIDEGLTVHHGDGTGGAGAHAGLATDAAVLIDNSLSHEKSLLPPKIVEAR